MAKAQIDCSAIWQTCGPRFGEAAPNDCQGSYGLSIMVNEEEFDYWATIEYDQTKPPPAEMETVEIPAGLYAKVTVPSLGQLSEVYTFIYANWLKSQKAYAYRMDGPCFEFYPPNWRPEDALDIFMPLVKI